MQGEAKNRQAGVLDLATHYHRLIAPTGVYPAARTSNGNPNIYRADESQRTQSMFIRPLDPFRYSSATGVYIINNTIGVFVDRRTRCAQSVNKGRERRSKIQDDPYSSALGGSPVDEYP